MTLAITPLYAGIIGLLFVLLSVLVITARGQARVSMGDGGDQLLIRRIRVQANCAEYAPLGLILLGMAELQGAPGWVVHLLGLMLLLGRVLHAVGFGRVPEIMWMRVVGMALTFAMLMLGAVANIGHALF